MSAKVASTQPGFPIEISGDKQAEDMLTSSEAELRALFASMHDVVVVIDRAGIYRMIAPTNPELLVKPPEELLGKTLQDVFPPEQAETFTNVVHQVLDSKQTAQIEYDLIIGERTVQFETSISPMTADSTLWVARDITERKRAEAALTEERLLLRTLLDSLPDHIYFKDRHSRFTHLSESQAKRFGLDDPAKALGKTDFDFFTEEHARSAFEVEQKIIATGQPVMNLEEKETSPDGRVTWVNTTKMPLLDQAGAIIGTFGISRDITERKRNELVQKAIYRITQATITSERIDELYHSIHSILGELIPVENFYIALVEPASDLISFPYYIDQYDERPSGLTKIQGLTGYVIRTGSPLLVTRAQFDRLAGQGDVEVVGTPFKVWMGAPLKVQGRIIGVMAVQSYTLAIQFGQEELNLLEFVSTQVAQAIERKRMEQEIRTLSFTDELTGLNNRRGFTLLAEQELKLAYRFKRGVLLFFGDVDDLKTINDTYGHAQGDLALQELAAILRDTFREVDILARIGGDEFVVFAVDASIESTNMLTKRMRASLEEYNCSGDRPWHLSLSLGTARCDTESPKTLAELISQADGQMYAQKQARQLKS